MEISSLPQELASHRTEELPAYALQQLFRWIADVAVMEAFESGLVDLPDFYFTGDDYRYRFEPEAKHRLLDLLRERFNSGAKYKGRVLKWDTVIEQKAVELSRFLVSRLSKLDFSNPSAALSRSDDRRVRDRILSLTQAHAQTLGVRKSSLHHLRKAAQGNDRFRVLGKTRIRLDL